MSSCQVSLGYAVLPTAIRMGAIMLDVVMLSVVAARGESEWGEKIFIYKDDKQIKKTLFISIFCQISKKSFD